ncbi:MAG: hypothetical protein HY905_08075 [Deltaproteobacteria bacterium]|nr:hypothetical protein [Deltaproteobacteria bacterium]
MMRGSTLRLAGCAALLGTCLGCSLELHEVGLPGEEDGGSEDGGSDAGCADEGLACSGDCIDPTRDPDNCGSCGTVCGAHASCETGECVCGTGFTPCPAGCFRLDNDRLNCGACEHACAVGETCRRSGCAPE